MYLHIGNNKNIRIRDIIGIFDTDNATLSRTTKIFLAQAERRGELASAADEIPKSFVLYREGEGCALCFSPLSVASLSGRLSGAAGGKARGQI